jgi:DedD protein
MDSGLKQRLLGAVVLIALAVVFVPMLLPSASSTGSQTVSVKIPAEPDSAMQTRTLQVGPDGATAGSSTAAAVIDPDHVATLDLGNGRAANAASSAPAASPLKGSAPAAAMSPVSAPASASAQAVAKAGPQTSAALKPAPVEPEAAKTGPLPGGAGAAAKTLYSVNLGIYADHASADELVSEAKKHGFIALASPETFQGKPVLRVQVGPYSTRVAAEAARLKLQAFERVASMRVEATAMNEKGDAPASALPADQSGAWAVQLAAFATEAQADALRDRLRSQGFDGYVDSVTTAKGKLWRVRAGPFISRETALAKRAEIVKQLQVKNAAIVTQH